MFKLLKKAYPYYGKIYGILGLCIILGLFQTVLALVEPQIISLIVDRVITPALGYEAVDDSSIFLFLLNGTEKQDVWKAMWILVGTFLVFLVVYFITFYIRWNVAHHYSIRQDNKLRLDVMKKINEFGTRLFKNYNSGELITIANSDTGKLRDAHIAIIPFMIDSIFAIVVGALLLSRISYLLMLIPLIALLSYLFLARRLLRKINELYGNLWEYSSALNEETQESIYGIRTIKAYAREKLREASFHKKNEKVRNCYVELGTTRYRAMLLFDSGNQILTFVCMIVSIGLALHMKMTSGEYMAFITYMLIIVGSFVDVVFYLANLQDTSVSADRLFTFLEQKDTVKASYGTKAVSRTPDITVKDLAVRSEDKFLLNQVNVDIPYGKKIGIMGKTGSGKSVFFKALQAFTELDSGNIFIDGEDRKTYRMENIVASYSYAMQDVFLFSNTIETNIAYFAPDAPMDRVLECAKAAKVDEFVDNLADGYQTIVGEKGFGLSGGQKQRVAIARALLKDAPVILLDDCTSALDVETEREIIQNLHTFAKEKTVLMATHRAAAIRDFDEILFFEDGCIAERGTFEELIAMQGKYAAIYHQQENGRVG